MKKIVDEVEKYLFLLLTGGSLYLLLGIDWGAAVPELRLPRMTAFNSIVSVLFWLFDFGPPPARGTIIISLLGLIISCMAFVFILYLIGLFKSTDGDNTKSFNDEVIPP